MASTLMHIAIANELYKKLKTNLNINYYDYILGTIAPNISQVLEEEKTKSHFFNEQEMPNIDIFQKKYLNNLDNSFNLGYYIHLYTDKLFYKDYYPLFIQDGFFTSNIKKIDGNFIKVSKEDKQKILYNDYTNLNIQLIEEYNLNLDIFYNEFIIPKTNITEIPIEKLNLIIESAGIIIQNLNKTKEYVIDISSIKAFIDDTIEEIYATLISLNLIN